MSCFRMIVVGAVPQRLIVFEITGNHDLHILNNYQTHGILVS